MTTDKRLSVGRGIVLKDGTRTRLSVMVHMHRAKHKRGWATRRLHRPTIPELRSAELIKVRNKTWSCKNLATTKKKKKKKGKKYLCWIDTPSKSHCWANPVLNGKGYSAFILLKTLVKPVLVPLCSAGFSEPWVNPSHSGDWLKPKRPSFSHASALTSRPPPHPPTPSQCLPVTKQWLVTGN